MASSEGVAAVFALFRRYDLACIPTASEIAGKVRDWVDMLDDVTDQDLLQAARAHIRDPERGTFFPKIAEIRRHIPAVRALPAEEGPPGQAIWSRLVKCISSAGFTRPEGASEGWLERLAAHLQVDAARLEAAIEAAGGGRAIAMASHDAERAWMGGRFTRAWDARQTASSRPQIGASEPIDLMARLAERKRLGLDRG